MKSLLLLGFLVMLPAAAWTQEKEPQQVKAGFRTGEEFLAFCPTNEPADQPTLNGALCIAYMRGYQDSMLISERIFHSVVGEDVKWAACVPQDATPSVALAVVRRWLGQHPDTLKQSIAAIVTAAFHDNFPCSTG